MKCPLLTKYEDIVNVADTFTICDCLMHECAWWDADQHGCAMKLIEKNLQRVNFRLGDMQAPARRV